MEIKRNTAAKYLGVFIDEHPTWKENTTVIQNKVSKNLASCTETAGHYIVRH